MVPCLLRTNSDAGVAVDGLHQLLALVADNPVGINLRGALGIQRNHLESTEVCFTDGEVLGAHVIDVQNAVVIKIIFARITAAIA